MIKAGFYKRHLWCLSRWEIVPEDPWNGYKWLICMPTCWIGWTMPKRDPDSELDASIDQWRQVVQSRSRSQFECSNGWTMVDDNDS